ncbi:hypothetical protein [Streptomyces griseoluteus]|uniref:hypothetical protein n=1 Tax=Streptomyces griseoluteus TaxID=29306 RepID=UPI0036D0BD12
MGRIAGRFARVEPRRRVRDLVLGLLSDLPRKNCWSIAEWAGETSPDGMQHLLGRARWDADAVRDDEHQLRRFTSWSRWVTLAMLAHAFLAVVRADEHARHPASRGLIPLTCNEIQRLFTTLIVRPVHDVAHWLRWSAWRRRHQARAQASHCRRQTASQT